MCHHHVQLGMYELCQANLLKTNSFTLFSHEQELSVVWRKYDITGIKVHFSIWHVVKADARHSFQIEAKFVTFRISSAPEPGARARQSRGNLDIVACCEFIPDTRLTRSIRNFPVIQMEMFHPVLRATHLSTSTRH